MWKVSGRKSGFTQKFYHEIFVTEYKIACVTHCIITFSNYVTMNPFSFKTFHYVYLIRKHIYDNLQTVKHGMQNTQMEIRLNVALNTDRNV